MIKDFMQKYSALMVVAVLLIAAFVINMRANGDKAEPVMETAEQPAHGAQELYAAESAAQGNYFENFRREREEVRKLEMEYLDEVIAASATDDETLADAGFQKLALVENMEKEFTIESLVRAKGFEDAAVTFHAGTLNIVVKSADELSGEEVAQILDIARRETGESAKNIKVMTGQ